MHFIHNKHKLFVTANTELFILAVPYFRNSVFEQEYRCRGLEQFCIETGYELCSKSARHCGKDHVCLRSVPRQILSSGQRCVCYMEVDGGALRVTAYFNLGFGL